MDISVEQTSGRFHSNASHQIDTISTQFQPTISSVELLLINWPAKGLHGARHIALSSIIQGVVKLRGIANNNYDIMTLHVTASRLLSFAIPPAPALVQTKTIHFTKHPSDSNPIG